MIISDLNYLEDVSESTAVSGGKKSNYGLGNLGINIATVTQVAVPTAIAINVLGKGYTVASTGTVQVAT